MAHQSLSPRGAGIPACSVEIRLDASSPYFPFPLSFTVCADPAALSVTLSDALRVPVTVGLNTTAMLQCAPAATELPHVFVCEKSFAAVLSRCLCL